MMLKRRMCGIRARGAVLLAASVFILATIPARTAEMLSEEETVAGWINLFDGETLYGWNQLGDAQWSVVDGNLVCESGYGGMIATTSRFADFELVARIRVKSRTSAGIAYRAGLEGHPSENGSGTITIRTPRGQDAQWHEVRIRAEGDEIATTVDGDDVEGLRPTRRQGHVGIQFHHVNGKVEVEYVKLRPLNMEPIFNGKDLSGWNIIPDRKSVFAVIDGALNIKNGNGQIETAGVYKDFALQLAIYSNGEHLNSGVFYRTPVGEFWMGYESQVRNHWEGDDRNKPVDYGTGGNYGNQPARRVVSSDREWFYKTIVCEGNHTAIWINGYLTSDFTDTRPVSRVSQGKDGYVRGPGTINLQGHDPTTDLSFKNIRIQVYPEN